VSRKDPRWQQNKNTEPVTGTSPRSKERGDILAEVTVHSREIQDVGDVEVEEKNPHDV